MRSTLMAVNPHSSIRSIPWARIVTFLAAAMVTAWAVGFLAGLVVRFVVPALLW